MNLPDEELVARIHRDLRDDLDEELELEFEDRQLDTIAAADGGPRAVDAAQRRAYFRELFRLQAELVKCRTGSWRHGTRW